MDDGPRNVDLWSRARHLGQGFSSIRSPEALAAKVLAIDRMLTGVNASAEARVVFTHVFGRDAVITNLGVVNLPRNYGPLALQAVWGPCVAAGFAGEPVIGASTFGDHLHLLHTSYGAIKGLLDQMVAEITLALTRRC